MQIFVRTLDDRTLTFNVQADDTIEHLKELVEDREGFSFEGDFRRFLHRFI